MVGVFAAGEADARFQQEAQEAKEVKDHEPFRSHVFGVPVFVCLMAFSGTSLAEPVIVNPGFEADTYTKYPGYAVQNGGVITGWEIEGRAGINPTAVNATSEKDPSPFADNSNVPEGKQVLFIQNQGKASQVVEGFVKGRSYIVKFRENGRAYNQSATFARLVVRLGDQTVVSPHLVKPVCRSRETDLPYARVVSAAFTAPEDGAFRLTFEALNTGGVSVLIDDVHIEEKSDETHLGSIVYTAESALLQGRLAISVGLGPLNKVATPLACSIPSAPANENYERFLDEEVLYSTADVECNVLPKYYMETYLEHTETAPIRSVRWGEGRPDVVFDFLAGGRLVITRAKWASTDAGTLIRSIFGSHSTHSEAPSEIESSAEPEAVGAMVTDLLTAFLKLPASFRDADKIDRPVRRFGIKKRMTSIYCATFTPENLETIELTINGQSCSRDARKFSWRLSYCCPVTLSPDSTFAKLCEKFYPEQPKEEALVLLHELLGDDLKKWIGRTVALPVSPAVHTDFFNRERNNGLEPPFGISEAGEAWFDTETGMPLRVRGGVHGLAGEANLSKVEGSFAEALGIADK